MCTVTNLLERLSKWQVHRRPLTLPCRTSHLALNEDANALADGARVLRNWHVGKLYLCGAAFEFQLVSRLRPRTAMICRGHLLAARARQNFVCARSCGLGMEGRNQYSQCFPAPSTIVDVTEDGGLTSSCRCRTISEAARVEFSPQKMWTKSVSRPTQMPSWPQWRPPFFREDPGGLHADDASEPHGDSGCDHLCVAGVKCGAIIKFQQIPSRWWTSTASRNGRRHVGAPHCSGWCCPPAEELSCQRKLLLFADWIRVPTCSWSRKRTSSNCSTLPFACAVAHGSLPPREEELPRNSAIQGRHKKILPRVTSTAHPVQPARHEKKLSNKTVLIGPREVSPP